MYFNVLKIVDFESIDYRFCKIQLKNYLFLCLKKKSLNNYVCAHGYALNGALVCLTRYSKEPILAPSFFILFKRNKFC